MKINYQPNIYYSLIETHLGWVGISGSEQGLKRLVLPEKKEEEVLKQLTENMARKTRLILSVNYFSLLVEKIRDYFNGKPVYFEDQRADLSEYTRFQKTVLLKTREIPYGTVRTYRWLAEQSGYPLSYRAVGGVMRINPLPLIIPCHRIIGSKGKLTGFSATGGVALKGKMLEMEGIL